MQKINSKSHFRWVVVSLLFLITIINYIDRASLSYAIEAIAKEFHLTKDQIGLILGAFGLGYVFTTLLGGIAADKYGAKRTLSASIICWSIASLLTGAATGVGMLFMARVLLGVAEGPNFPSLARAVGDWLPEKERNRALSNALISVPLALALGGPVISQIILLFSWRGTYFILAFLSIVWLPFWWFLFHDKPRDSSFVNKEELTHIEENAIIKSEITKDKNPWGVLLFNKTLLANNWSFFVFGYFLFFFMTWLPTYLLDKFHLDLTQVGLYSVFPWLLAAGMMWAVGVLSDHLFKKTKSLRLSRSYPILITQGLSALFILPTLFTNDIFFVIMSISLSLSFAMSANASFYAVNIDIAKERAGSSLGIMDAIFAIAGFVSPAITGLIVSITGQYNSAFGLLAVLAISSTVIIFFFHNRHEKTKVLC